MRDQNTSDIQLFIIFLSVRKYLFCMHYFGFNWVSHRCVITPVMFICDDIVVFSFSRCCWAWVGETLFVNHESVQPISSMFNVSIKYLVKSDRGVIIYIYDGLVFSAHFSWLMLNDIFITKIWYLDDFILLCKWYRDLFVTEFWNMKLLIF